jgi:hypothetical protein
MKRNFFTDYKKNVNKIKIKHIIYIYIYIFQDNNCKSGVGSTKKGGK